MKRLDARAEDAAIREAAARWAIRRDRGLSASEAIEFELWLAADARHRAALQRSAATWRLLDRVPEAAAERHLAAGAGRRTRRRWLGWAGSLAAAAALVLAFVGAWRTAPPAEPGTAIVAGPARAATLADGSRVRLNAGSEVVEQFTPGERQVRLVRGEAHFMVAHDAARPFVVSAGALRVRAVGTAFNVRLAPEQIEVIVTEGRVGIERSARAGARRTDRAPLHLGAGERAVAAAGGAGAASNNIVVTRVAAAELAQSLAWQDELLPLSGATLGEIAAEFERRTGRRIEFADPALAQLRFGGRFRADDVEGFADLLGAMFEVDAERAADGTLRLRKKTSVSR